MRFCDVVILAKDMHKSMGTTMPISPIDIVGSSKCIESEIHRYYSHHPKTIEIVIYQTQPIDDETNGLYTRYEFPNKTLFDIDVSASLNTCWERLVATKELMHAIIDKNSSAFTTDIVGLIEMLINRPPQISNDSEIHSEYVALYLAVELLIPDMYNNYVIDSSLSSYHVADTLKVPEKMIDLVRAEWYQELRKESY
jgi:hypothetical protein